MPTAEFNYAVGDKAPNGEKIAFIYGQSPDVIVYEDDQGNFQWGVRPDQLSTSHRAALSTWDYLWERVRKWFPDKERKPLYHELANALFVALGETDARLAPTHFASTKAHIDAKVLSIAKDRYLKIGAWMLFALLATASVLGVLRIRLDIEILGCVGLAIAGSAFGSWTSVLQRTPALPVAVFDAQEDIKFQSIYRSVLGVTFGLVALLFIKAGLLLPDAGSSIWQLLLVTFISGFSERFIPEMLAKVEKTYEGNAPPSSSQGNPKPDSIMPKDGSGGKQENGKAANPAEAAPDIDKQESGPAKASDPSAPVTPNGPEQTADSAPQFDAIKPNSSGVPETSYRSIDATTAKPTPIQ